MIKPVLVEIYRNPDFLFVRFVIRKLALGSLPHLKSSVAIR